MNMKKILLINQGKTANLGDIAIKNIAIKLLQELNCDVDFVGYAQCNEQKMSNLLTNENKGKLKKYIPSIVKYFFISYRNVLKEFKRIKNNQYDLVIIGGGQLIKSDSIFPYCLFFWTYLLNKKNKIYLLSVGMDSKYNFLEELFYRYSFSKIEKIYFRENDSREVCKKIYHKNSEYIPDLVFAYSRYNKKGITLPSEKRKYLMVMIYDYQTLVNHFKRKISKEKYYKEWIELIKRNNVKNFEIILTYTDIGDKEETIKFYDYLQKERIFNCNIKNTDILDSFVRLLPNTNIVISGRMHAMILAYNYECKIVPYTISDKIKSFENNYLKNKENLKSLENKILKTVKKILK